MSGREWAPGDVVAFTLGGCEYHGIIDTDGRPYTTDKRARGRLAAPEAIRPFVAIDPENRQQAQQLMSRLLCELGMSMSTTAATDAMQAALREFANPTPRIEEPTGWGAVVEDDTGAYWTLYAPEAGVWINYREGTRKWAHITPVRVLSKGVTS